MFRSLVLATFVACGGSSEPAAQPEPQPAERPASTEHAVADVVPGSHADWCGEHAVPESQCTRCNADLVPAFEATGDWCGEHGLPASQCLACDPELVIERPPEEG